MSKATAQRDAAGRDIRVGSRVAYNLSGSIAVGTVIGIEARRPTSAGPTALATRTPVTFVIRPEHIHPAVGGLLGTPPRVSRVKNAYAVLVIDP